MCAQICGYRPKNWIWRDFNNKILFYVMSGKKHTLAAKPEIKLCARCRFVSLYVAL